MAVDKAARHRSLETSGSIFLVTEAGRLLSLPIPSNSPSDPLNWCLRKRVTVFSVMLLFSVIGMAIQQFPGLLYMAFFREFKGQSAGPFSIDHLSSVPTLFMGIGCILWLPLCLWIGRRPVFLMSAALLAMSTAWAGATTSLPQLTAAICLQGLANGAAVSTFLLTIIDITFIHQRPHAIACYWSVGAGLTQLILTMLPLMGEVTRQWRPVYYYFSIPCFVTLILAFFLVPETYFCRPPVALDGRILVQGGSEKIKIYEDWDELPGGRPVDLEYATASPSTSPTPGMPSPSVQRSRWQTWRRQLRLYAPSGGDWRSFLACYPQICLCLVNPLIFWVMLLNAANFGGMMSIGMTYPLVLIRPPYSLSMQAVALVNLAASIGSFLGWPASGIVIARLTHRLARRNGGVRHAEYLLPGFALPVLAGVASLVIYGVAVRAKAHFIWIYVSYALNAFSYVGASVANTLWVTEAFPRWAAAALAVVGGVSYIISFGLSYAIHPWLQSQGFAGTNIQIAVIMLVFGLVGVPVAFWGQNVRQFIEGRWGAYEAGAMRPQ